MSVNGRARAIRCSICINIYSASVRRVLRNGSQTSFIPTCFARAAKQIHRIPWGGRAASPTDRLTVLATNHTQPSPLPPSLPHCLHLQPPPPPNPPPHLLPHLVKRGPPCCSRAALPDLNIFVPARSIRHHNKKSKRERIFYARSSSMLQPREYTRRDVPFLGIRANTTADPPVNSPLVTRSIPESLLTCKDARYRGRGRRNGAGDCERGNGLREILLGVTISGDVCVNHGEPFGDKLPAGHAFLRIRRLNARRTSTNESLLSDCRPNVFMERFSSRGSFSSGL